MKWNENNATLVNGKKYAPLIEIGVQCILERLLENLGYEYRRTNKQKNCMVLELVIYIFMNEISFHIVSNKPA